MFMSMVIRWQFWMGKAEIGSIGNSDSPIETHGFSGFGRTGFGRDEIYPDIPSGNFLQFAIEAMAHRKFVDLLTT